MRHALGERQRRVLAGRAARHEEVDAGVDLPAAEPPDRRFVEVAGPGERRDERRADASARELSHSPAACALYLTRQPEHVLHREPAAPALDPSRCGKRARGERGAIARRVRQRDRLGRAVEPDRVRAGNEAGARRRDVDCARSKPASSIARFSSSAVPDGASFLAA